MATAVLCAWTTPAQAHVRFFLRLGIPVPPVVVYAPPPPPAYVAPPAYVYDQPYYGPPAGYAYVGPPPRHFYPRWGWRRPCGRRGGWR
ncbi:MAG: hypothetical protein HY270_00250 [Deltaproteobacteria bacterium]|nr:hypothetical protein [Deltaproteobacteria bacterium]